MLSTDIAVGAPYDDKGKVFIYHGSANGINTKPTQVISSIDFYNGRGGESQLFAF